MSQFSSFRAFILLVFCGFSSIDPSFAISRSDSIFTPFFGDLPYESLEARNHGKKAILLFFEMDDCPFCARMRSQVLSNSKVQSFTKTHFSVFSINTQGAIPITGFDSKTSSEAEFSISWRVHGTPTLLFFSLDGILLARFTGPTKDIEEFLLLTQYALDGGSKTLPPFNVYQKNIRSKH